jgi:hypothetical protein
MVVVIAVGGTVAAVCMMMLTHGHYCAQFQAFWIGGGTSKRRDEKRNLKKSRIARKVSPDTLSASPCIIISASS